MSEATPQKGGQGTNTEGYPLFPFKPNTSTPELQNGAARWRAFHLFAFHLS